MNPKEAEKKVEIFTFYLTLGLIAVFVVVILMLVLQFLVNVLVAISMGG